MAGVANHNERKRARRGQRWLLAVLVAVPLGAAACGGSSTPQSVASLGTTTSRGAGGEASGSAAPLFPPGTGGIGASISTQMGTGAAGVKYTACMRSHGVPNFPDPDAEGTITITVSRSLNPSAPQFQKAEADCKHLAPAGKGLSPAKQQQTKTRLLAFAACMRSHGVPKYPDPTFGAGGMVSQSMNQREVDPKSPTFRSAQKTCQSKAPGS
jgi:hypothetical protein